MRSLIICQTPPADTGLGAAMRMGNILRSVAGFSEVTLVLVTADQDIKVGVSEAWRDLCNQVFFVNVHKQARHTGVIEQVFQQESKLLSAWPLEYLADALQGLNGQHFDTALIVRLRMMPIWEMLGKQLGVTAGRAVMDLDDIESRAHQRSLALLGRQHYGRLGYVLQRLEVGKLRHAEARAAKRMQALSVCSADDAAELNRQVRKPVAAILPNCINRVGEALPLPDLQDIRLMFIGALDYAPNADAVKWLSEDILPAIRQRLGEQRVQCMIVGRKAAQWMRDAAQAGHFSLYEDVPEVRSYYERCNLLLVPIRSGGGTRIKILESFAYGRAVISSSIGAEGLGLKDGQELLIANTPEMFASAIEAIASARIPYANLVNCARQCVLDNYAPSAFASRLATIMRG